MACHACRIIGKKHVDMVLSDVLEAASELPSYSTTAGGEPGPQAAHEAARAAASSAEDARPQSSTLPGASLERLTCVCDTAPAAQLPRVKEAFVPSAWVARASQPASLAYMRAC